MGSFKGWLQKMFGIPAGGSGDSPGAATPPVANPAAEESHFRVVRVQPTPNPDAFQFIMSGPVISEGTKTFNSADEAKGDPLGEALFGIFGIENVFLKESYVTVTKSKVVGWHTVMETVGETIENHLHFYDGGTVAEESKPEVDPVLESFKKDEFATYSEKQKTEVIEALLDVAIRPALSNDGGGLDILGIDGSVVKIHYQGACGSCPSSTTGTLNYIENFLKEAVHPDLTVQAN
ncbi:MAG: iron transporter [Nitrospinaceae bacterium]|nr:MAG: iron transporter [Nitrospinaceae bacterium]